MRPLLGVHFGTEGWDPEAVAETIAEYARHEWGGEVAVFLLRDERELAEYQAGQMVVYRKPVRVDRSAGELGYRTADGEEVRLRQEPLFGEE